MAKQRGKWKDRLKFVIPIVILLVGIGFIYAFEFHIKDKVNTVQVLVAKTNIDFKEIITPDHLAIANVKRDQQVENSFRPDEIDYIVGKLASIDISKGTQIYPDLIDSYDLVPDPSKGEFIAPIPDNWIFAVAGSLRRAYYADFYLVSGDNQSRLDRLVENAKNESSLEETMEVIDESDNEETDHESEAATNIENETNIEEENNESIPQNVIENVITEEQIKELYKPILTDIRISSVKDSGNREVKESQENPDSATGNVSNLEIIATNEILQTLHEKMEQGYKLYIVHKFEKSTNHQEEGETEE